jgi:hypothetical protein
MRRPSTKWLVGVFAFSSFIGRTAFAQEITDEDIVLESLPEHVVATMEARDRWIATLPSDDGFQLFSFVDFQRWTPGQTIRVAFLDGTKELHKEVADATQSITSNCNIKLDFGLNATTGEFRRWTTSDASYAGDIRVSFDQVGNFSLVGKDSIDPNIGSPLQPVGGRPRQRSLNLGGFAAPLASSRQRTVRHEFLHALAFHHEHQNPLGGCDAQFRWEDDPGYIQNKDSSGRFINDSSNRRPGIYTYLSGFPNFWDRAKVDRNLRKASLSTGEPIGAFDRASIMLYRFEPLFYVSNPNPCAPSADATDDLSAGDIAALKVIYPFEEAAVAGLAERNAKLIESVREAASLEQSQKESLLQGLEQ